MVSTPTASENLIDGLLYPFLPFLPTWYEAEPDTTQPRHNSYTAKTRTFSYAYHARPVVVNSDSPHFCIAANRPQEGLKPLTIPPPISLFPKQHPYINFYCKRLSLPLLTP